MTRSPSAWVFVIVPDLVLLFGLILDAGWCGTLGRRGLVRCSVLVVLFTLGFGALVAGACALRRISGSSLCTPREWACLCCKLADAQMVRQTVVDLAAMLSKF